MADISLGLSSFCDERVIEINARDLGSTNTVNVRLVIRGGYMKVMMPNAVCQELVEIDWSGLLYQDDEADGVEVLVMDPSGPYEHDHLAHVTAFQDMRRKVTVNTEAVRDAGSPDGLVHEYVYPETIP